MQTEVYEVRPVDSDIPVVDARRTFTRGQRDILFARSGGLCQRCGIQLQRSWTADHVIPWSVGGQTHIDNGQALCHACNLEKGDGTGESPFDLRRDQRVVGDWPIELAARAWTRTFLIDYLNHNRANYLLVATPGAGKTLAALQAAHERFRRGDIDRLVILAPTDAVRGQWYTRAASVGIQLAPVFQELPLPHWLNGVAITYQALVNAQNRLAELCASERVMVVLDEVHHAAETARWGHALTDALSEASGASYRLALSGTPFRTDGEPIAGLQLQRDPADPKWFNVAHDFTYDYYDALLDGDVVREVFFPRFDGEMRWISRYDPGTVQVASFRDEVKRGEAQQRLRTFLWATEGHGLRSMLAAANDQLRQLHRDGDRSAQGLVTAIDQAHADRIRGLLTEVSGEEPVIVTYDEPRAVEDLREFERGDRHWLVAVRMASEGYDNRRLRVGVYASTWTTPMFFRQFVGRFVRYNAALGPMLRQPAFVYIPDDERLVAIAGEIYAEVEQASRIRAARLAEGWAGDEHEEKRLSRRPSQPDPERAFHPLRATGAQVGVDGPVAIEELIARQQTLDAPVEPDYLRAIRLTRELNTLMRQAGDPAVVERWLDRQEEAA